jgi:hypothetical protein
LTNRDDHLWQQSFHNLFTKTHYHTKVFIDRYTSKQTATLDRYIDHPEAKQTTDTVQQMYYQIGQLDLAMP